MPPKRTAGASASSSRTKATKTKTKAAPAPDPEFDNPFESSDDQATPRRTETVEIGDEEEDQPEKSIPKDLLTRLLHEFFSKDSTRISRDANAAVGKYIDVFVREAIARTAVEKQGGFLEVSLFAGCIVSKIGSLTDMEAG